jgi:tetratricopeptide (TPR) repeat protein
VVDPEDSAILDLWLGRCTVIFEWYSGSDRAGDVPRQLANLREASDLLSAEEKLAILTRALEREKDPNWRAYILTECGLVRRLSGDHDGAVEAFEMARLSFDVVAGNFDDVKSMYGAALYYLLEEKYFDLDDIEAAVLLSFQLLVVLDQVDLAGYTKPLFFAFISSMLNRLGEKLGKPDLFAMAVSAAARAHHEDPDDFDLLESLFNGYFNQRDRRGCERVLAMMKGLSPGHARLAAAATAFRERFESDWGADESN